jgi:hypothetical protein
VSESPDKRFLIAVLIFGIVAASVSATWLKIGKVTPNHRPSPGYSRVADEIPRGHVLYYFVTIAWGLLGNVMIVLSGLAHLSNDERALKACAWCCVAILVLGFLTAAATRLAGS